MNNLPPRRMCTRCVLVDSPPDITIDDSGLCSVCRRIQCAPAPKAEEFLESDFTKILAKHRGKAPYDCLVMCSGGKDSTSSLFYMKRRYKMNPLAFTFDHGFETEDALENVRKAVEILGVDFLFFRSTYMSEMFKHIIESGSKAVLCHLCSIWYMQLTFDIAARYDIPIIIAGWTKGQSTKQGVMSKCACNVSAPEYQSMSKATKEYLAALKRDPRYKDFPQSMEEVLERAKKRHKAMVLSPHWFLGAHADEYVELIQKELDWKYPRLSYPGRSTNCYLNFISAHKSIENYGFTHYHVEMSKLIRENLLSRDEALEMLDFSYDREFLESIAGRVGARLP